MLNLSYGRVKYIEYLLLYIYICNLALFKYMYMLLAIQWHSLAMQILVANAPIQENNVIKLMD